MCTQCLFLLPQKLEINRLIEYWVDLTLYQRLNASFEWIFNRFGRFLISRSIFTRGLGPTGPGGPARKNASTDEEMSKIQGTSNQMMHSIVGKVGSSLSSQSNDCFQAFGKEDKGLGAYIWDWSYDFILLHV